MSAAANDGPDGCLPDLEQWFDSSLGRLLLSLEKAWMAEQLAHAFGYYLLQLSALSDQDMAEKSTISSRFQLANRAGQSGRSGAVARFEALPLANDSVDVVILHHVLEFSEQPHQLLREAYRVLIPGGQLLVVSINPRSLFGLRNALLARLGNTAWRGNRIGARRLLDWMSLLELQVCEVQQTFHQLPVQAPGLLGRFDALWQCAARYSLPGGGVFMVRACKEVSTLTPLKLKPAWRAWRSDVAPLGAANSRWDC